MVRLSASARQLDWLVDDFGILRSAYERDRHVGDAGPGHWVTLEEGGRCVRAYVQRPARVRVEHAAIVYFHGGGWIVGSPMTHADISRGLSEAAGLPLVSVDYRLAPEHPAPAPIEDGALAARQLLRQGIEGGRYERVVLCGDSAGAAIALAVAARLAADLGQALAGVCAAYGFYGGLDSPTLLRLGRREEGLDRASIARMWMTANGGLDPSPYAIASLLSAPSIPPVHLIGAGNDPVIEDTLGLAAGLRAGGRQVSLDVVPGVGHGFLHRPDTSEVARAAIGTAADWMVQQFRIRETA